VSLAALAGTIVCVLGGLYAVIEVATPDLTMKDYAWAYHQTNDRYWQMAGLRHDSNTGRAEPDARPPEDELTRRRLESFEVERGTVRREGWVALLMFATGLAISVAMFRVHWRLARAFRPPRSDPLPPVPPN